jgi:subtilisin family serine protease
MREGAVDFTASQYIAAGRATNSFRIALTLTDDATDEVAWMGKTIGTFSGLSVALLRDGATQELWVDDFSAPTVLTDPFPDGFGYQGEILRFQEGGIETNAENRFDIALLLDLTPVLPEGGLVEGDWVAVRSTANFTRSQPEFIPLTGIQITYLDDVARRDYTNGLGTSFASPLVAGVAALLLEARPGWTPLQVLEALRSTASQADVPDNEVGYGIVNASRALFNSDVPPSADLDGSGSVDLDDLSLFHQDWRTVRTSNETPLGSAIRSDLNLDSQIDGDDLYLISSQWQGDSP